MPIKNKKISGLGVVAYACNTSYSEGRSRRIMVRGQPQAKVRYSKKKDWGSGSSRRALD
jgi:hypothetical protein